MENENIPEGKVKLPDGKIIDRADVAYKLRPHPQSKKLFFATDKTCYQRDEKGTLRRFPQKVKGGKKMKKNRRLLKQNSGA